MNVKEQLKLLDKVKKRIKSSNTVKKIFKEADVDLDIIDMVPMCFADLEVSARTQHGIIYFNKDLMKSPEEIDHYMVHELTHIVQQCFSDKATTGSNADNYLDNPYEQEGFQNQTKFITETEGKEEAEEYINKVLEHHDVPRKEKEDKRDALLSYASDNFEEESRKRKAQLERLIGILYPEQPRDLSKEEIRELNKHVAMMSEDKEYNRAFQDFLKLREERLKPKAQLIREKNKRDLGIRRNLDAREGARNVMDAIEQAIEDQKNR